LLTSLLDVITFYNIVSLYVYKNRSTSEESNAWIGISFKRSINFCRFLSMLTCLPDYVQILCARATSRTKWPTMEDATVVCQTQLR